MDDILRDTLKKTLSKDSSAVMGEVVSVDMEKVLCEVKILENEDLIFSEVRLRAIDDEQDKGFVLFPKVGSQVLMAKIKDTDAYYIAMMSEIKKVSFQSNEEDLKAILADLLTAIKTLTVPTGVGPSGTPINVLDFQNIELRINKFFK
jgi:hypothetical protein